MPDFALAGSEPSAGVRVIYLEGELDPSGVIALQRRVHGARGRHRGGERRERLDPADALRRPEARESSSLRIARCSHGSVLREADLPASAAPDTDPSRPLPPPPAEREPANPHEGVMTRTPLIDPIVALRGLDPLTCRRS